MSKEDPKPGRWILPIVIVSLIGFTYVFVNALPPADIVAATTTTTIPPTTTLPETTTTTTMPAALRAFLQELDRFENVASDLATELNDVNAQWENRDINFDAALAGFREVEEDAQTLANQVAATTLPEAFTTAWPETIAASQVLVTQTGAVIAGLRAPDDGTLRRAAVAEYAVVTTAFNSQLDVVRLLTP